MGWKGAPPNCEEDFGPQTRLKAPRQTDPGNRKISKTDIAEKVVYADFFDQENGGAPVKQVRRVQKYGLAARAAKP